MYINALGHYLPKQIISNDYFLNINGLTDEWIFTRTGIKTRTKAIPGENTHTMGIEAVKEAMKNLPYPISDVDLIIGASYSPFDTVATLAHAVQEHFEIAGAKAVYISSACSSFINAMEIVEGYFAIGKASKALVVTSEHNTAYSNETDEKSGHLWGDGAAAIFLSKEPVAKNEGKVVDIITRGLGNIGKASEAVYLHPTNGGLLMPHGKDVFTHACKYMTEALVDILEKTKLRYLNSTT
jgi:3-oxoacyl-[acyl-carrier-protein] synthase-3